MPITINQPKLYNLMAEEVRAAEEEYKDIKALRQAYRIHINELEMQLENLK